MPSAGGWWRAAGEGALGGVAAGLAWGAWGAYLHKDLAHGLRWLALERLDGPALAGGLAGMAASLLLALLLGRGSGGRALPAAVGVTALAAAGAALGPWRDDLFPLAMYSSGKLALAGSLAVILAALAPVALRLADRLPAVARAGVRLRGVAAACGLLLLAGAAVAWMALPTLAAGRARGRPPVIIVSLDTLRADRLGAYGSTSGLTPHLDRLAAEGMVFDQASSTAPWTLPSHTSLFTSLLPFDHHVRWSWMKIHPERAMLAERFKDAGYRTAAFTGGGYVSSDFGFDQGFEIYENHDEILEGGPGPIAAAALDWVRRHRDEPFFLFLHTYEPHSPFIHTDRANPDDAGQLPPEISYQEVEAIHKQELVLTERERRYVVDMYDGDAAHTDKVMGGLLATLQEEGILDGAILVILSDHGEDLWDHDPVRSPGHGHSLYEELIRVPLVVRAPGTVLAGARIHTPVSLMDVAPTLLELAGLPADRHHEGRSLAAALRTGAEPATVPVRAESVEYGPDRFSHRLGDLKVILTPTPEVVHNNVKLEVRPLEIFDLAADPGEQASIADEGVVEARPMVGAVRERVQEKLLAHGEEPGDPRDLPEALRQQLKSLGYIQ